MISSGSHCVATLICKVVRDRESERSGTWGEKQREGLIGLKTRVGKRKGGCGECNVQTEQLKINRQ